MTPSATRPTPRLLALGFAFALATLSIAGCGRGGGTPAARSGDEPGPEPTRRLRILAVPHLSMAPLLIGEAEGYFRDEGLELERLALTSSRDGLPSLIQGELDVLAASLSPSFLNAIAQGAHLRIVADKGHLDRDGCTYLAFLARPELLLGRDLRRPEGRRLVVSVKRGSYFELLAEQALGSIGLGWDDVDLQHLDGQAEALALQQGRVDLASATGVPMQRQVDAGTAAVWRTAQELLPDGQFAVLLFGPSLLEGDPEAGRRFMTAYLRAVRQYNRGRTERNLALLEASTGLERSDLEAACWIAMRDDGRIDLDSIGTLQRWAAGRGLLDRELAAAEVWEPAFVEEAARRLAERDPGSEEADLREDPR